MVAIFNNSSYLHQSRLEEVKEKASSKFKTFIRRTKRIEANADKAFRNVMSTLFGEDENAAYS